MDLAMTIRKRRQPTPGFKIPPPYNALTGERADLIHDGVFPHCGMMQIAAKDTKDDYVLCRGYDTRTKKFIDYEKGDSSKPGIAVAKPYGNRVKSYYKIGDVYPAFLPVLRTGQNPGYVEEDSDKILGHPADLNATVDFLKDENDVYINWMMIDTNDIILGQVDSTILGRTGSVVSSGSVSVYTADGDVLTDTNLDIDEVYNLAVSAVTIGTYVGVLYIAGKWWIIRDESVAGGLVRFEVTDVDGLPKELDKNGTAEILTWDVDGEVLQKGGTTIGLVDSVGMWGKAECGYRGWAQQCLDRPTVTVKGTDYVAYEIVWMEGQARYGECVLATNMEDGTAEAKVNTAGLKFWGAPPNHHPPPTDTIILQDRYDVGDGLEEDTKCLYVYDEQEDEYVLLAPGGIGKVKVDAGDRLDYLEDQYEDHIDDTHFGSYDQWKHGIPIAVDTIDESEYDETARLRMWLPFDKIGYTPEWDGTKVQVLINDMGTLRWKTLVYDNFCTDLTVAQTAEDCLEWKYRPVAYITSEWEEGSVEEDGELTESDWESWHEGTRCPVG